jgi:hypothetical protein
MSRIVYIRILLDSGDESEEIRVGRGEIRGLKEPILYGSAMLRKTTDTREN